MDKMRRLQKKIKFLHYVANWMLTPLVILFIAVYFFTKPISVWDVILAILVVVTTFVFCVLAIVYSVQYKKLQKQEKSRH